MAKSNRGFGGKPTSKPAKLGSGKATLKGDMHGSNKKGVGKTMK